MRSWSDSNGSEHILSRIDWRLHCRLKAWGVCDLVKVVNNPELWESLFDRLSSDGEFIVNLAYALEHETLGTDEQQLAFGCLVVGENGCGSLLECSEALREAVIDFFPEDRRDAIRQLHLMTVTQKALKTIQSHCPDTGSAGSDSMTETSGSNQCSESSDTTAAVSA